MYCKNSNFLIYFIWNADRLHIRTLILSKKKLNIMEKYKAKLPCFIVSSLFSYRQIQNIVPYGATYKCLTKYTYL